MQDKRSILLCMTPENHSERSRKLDYLKLRNDPEVLERLGREYAGKCVVLTEECEVVASGDSYEEVERALEEAGHDPKCVVFAYISREREEFIFSLSDDVHSEAEKIIPVV